MLSECLTLAQTGLDHTAQLRQNVLVFNGGDELFCLPTTAIVLEYTEALLLAQQGVKGIFSLSYKQTIHLGY